MDRRRILRLAEVLIASQMRSGRSSSTASDFWGRPFALAYSNVLAFLVVLAVASQVIGLIGAQDESLVLGAAPQIMAFLPLLVLGSLLLAGVLFELSTSSRFTVSDAANWLPITPVEYVAASSLAATVVYSISGSVALGVGVALTWFTGNVGGLVLLGFLVVLTLFEGAVLIEMLRASTQRIASVVSKRTGAVTLVLRLLLFLGAVLAFQLAFNPLVLYRLLQIVSASNPLTVVLPFLWPSRALLLFLGGDPVGASLYVAGSVLLVAALVVAAAWLRVRFWAPTAAELDLGRHRYALPHPWLAAVGLSLGESTLVWKDLRGLVRRREMLPVLVLPLVITLISLISQFTTDPGARSSFSLGFLSVYSVGLFALLLSATSIGQERRAVQTLYSVPIPARGIFRAKTFSILLPALAFALALWLLVGVVLFASLRISVGLLVLSPIVAVVGCFVGLAFATRYSDFQERPRPRFLNQSAMLATMLVGLLVIFSVAFPFLIWLYSPSANPLPLAFPAVMAVLAIAIAFRLARSGADKLLRSVPV